MRPNGRESSKGCKRRPRWHRIGVALALVAVFGAACSSNKAGTASSGTSGGTTAGTAASSTINVGEIADLTGQSTFPGGADGAKAAIAAVNKAGGINDHRLNLIVCDSQGNPNVAAECANQMVSSHVLYVDDDHSNESDSFMPVLRSAGIPVMSGEPIGSDELSFPNSYILGSGTTAVGGAGALCAKLGSTKIGIAKLDIAGLTPIVNLIYKTIAPFGLSQTNTSITLIPPTAVDLSTYAAALIQKSTCIVEVLAPNQQVPMAAAVHSQDPSIPVVAAGGSTVAEWQAIGKLAANVCDNASFPAGLTGAPGMAKYNAEMDTYNRSGRRDIPSIAGWVGVHLAAKLLTKVANPTAAGYMQALNTAGTINLPPLPPLNFTRPVSLIPGVTRIMSEDVVYFRHVNGGGVAPFYGGQYGDVLSLKSQPPITTAPHC
jgi:branched-chain amino acid transport system substrate-binding protein